MGLSIYGSKSVFIDGVTAKETWGDGFYVGPDNPTDVTFCNVMADSNRRQGLSIVTGNGIVIKNSTFQNTGKTALQAGTAPMSGIDIEPDQNQTAENIQILNSKFLNNSNTGVLVTLNPHYTTPTLTKDISFVKNVKIDGNTFAGNNANWIDVSPPRLASHYST